MTTQPNATQQSFSAVATTFCQMEIPYESNEDIMSLPNPFEVLLIMQFNAAVISLSADLE